MLRTIEGSVALMGNERTLQHVSIWKKDQGWVHITPEQVEFKHTIPANYEWFLCECCDQPVTFVYSTEKVPHFKHPKGSNDCEEKLSHDSFYNVNKLGFSLPLKISNPEGLFTGGPIKLEIGFLPLPAAKLSLAQEQKAKLRITAINSEIPIVQFNINEERFSSEVLTYYSINNHIAKNYILRFENVNTTGLFSALWPPRVRGISPQGTLFDYYTGKRLP